MQVDIYAFMHAYYQVYTQCRGAVKKKRRTFSFFNETRHKTSLFLSLFTLYSVWFLVYTYPHEIYVYPCKSRVLCMKTFSYGITPGKVSLVGFILLRTRSSIWRRRTKASFCTMYDTMSPEKRKRHIIKPNKAKPQAKKSLSFYCVRFWIQCFLMRSFPNSLLCWLWLCK